MRQVGRRWPAAAAGAAAAVPLLLAAGGAILCESALRVPPGRRIAPDGALASSLASRCRAQVSNVELGSPDGARLSAWLFLPEKRNGGGVLLLHGVADTRRGVLGHAGYLLRAGYAVLAPDSRAHGVSGGDVMTLGVRERGDVALWAAWMRGNAGAGRLYGLGESMGAAILLQAADHFDAIAAESSFSTFREIARYRVAARSGLCCGLPQLLVESGFRYARLRYGVDLDVASPLERVRRTRIPVLLIHGAADTNVPPEQARRIVAANPAVSLWLIPGGGHTGALQRRPAETEARVLAWFGGAGKPAQPLPAGPAFRAVP